MNKKTGKTLADWHLAAARALGVLKQAPTRCGVGPAHTPQRVGACFSTPNETSEAMSSLLDY